MNKFILSAIVILAFVVYSFNQKRSDVVVPGNVTIISTSTSSTDNTSSAPTSSVKVVPVSKPASKPIPKPVPIPVPVVPVTVPTTTPTPIPTPVPVIPAPVNNGRYRDGEYEGDSADAYYGNVKVQAVIQDGRLANVVFLDYPQDRRTSIMINSRAMPILISEAIQSQDANVDTVSGASDTSAAFRQSLTTALNQALI